MSALVSFHAASLGYGSRTVLSNVSFEVPEGDFLGVVGPNGAGKTTILRSILGTLAPRAGTVSVRPGLRFGYVPQRGAVDAVYPLKVIDVVMMGRYDRIGLGRRPGPGDRALSIEALEHVGISHLAEQQFASLSGGQKQRSLIARALVGKPDMLVLDEPTEGMDLMATTQILGLVRELHASDRLTVLMVSHALNEVANYVNRIALVHQGGFQIGAVDDVMSEPVLSAMYGIPVDVERFDGHRIVVARPGATHRARGTTANA
ncbi:MAG: metal ABC transporter ATP-binding protein [Gemmatimonadaceae bacterium]|nr:metal ABC transporter ATP-binding protein [Gemmatimonadaceae bacterium]